MSNFDHVIDEKVAEDLKTSETYADYTGRDFMGYVWWENGVYCCEVWQWNSKVDYFSAPSPKELMDAISAKYGST